MGTDTAADRPDWAPREAVDAAAWARFTAARERLLAASVPCAWCKGAGTVDQWGRKVRCAPCAGTGLVNGWTGLHAQDDPDDDWDVGGAVERLRTATEPVLAPVRELVERVTGGSAACPACNGAGYPCHQCQWGGRQPAPVAALWVDVECPHCGGHGRFANGLFGDWACGICCKTGRVPIEWYVPFLENPEADHWFCTVEDLARDGIPEMYSEWSGEFSPRREARPGVCWRGIDFEQADLSGLDLAGADLADCTLGNVRGTSFRGADLSRAVFADPEELAGCDFTDAWLAGANLEGADLSASTVHLAHDLTDADLRGATGLSRRDLNLLRERGAIVDEGDGQPTRRA